MYLVNLLIIYTGRVLAYAIKALRLGEGVTWPGELALRINKNFIRDMIPPHASVILIAGTNGKTTTSRMIRDICIRHGKKICINESGANLDNGIASSLILDAGWKGKGRSGVFIFETDEASLPVVLKSVSPTLLVLLNLFRDQLDRYGEVDTIAGMWREALLRLTPKTNIVANADDPHLVYITSDISSPVSYFGLGDTSLFRNIQDHAADTLYCPKCGKKLSFQGFYFSHLGEWKCTSCLLTHPDNELASVDVVSPMEGTYNIYNTLAASLAGRILGIPDTVIREALRTFTPAFGRGEEVEFEGKTVKILLSKNPTGFNQSLRTVTEGSKKGPMILILNDRIPDGTDVSWIWDVDFEKVRKYTCPIIVSGSRCYDLGVRLQYSQIQHASFIVEPQSDRAIQKGIDLTKTNETLWILPTYSAMLDVRKIITGRKIL